MTLKFHAIETQADKTLLVFRKEGTVISMGQAFSASAEAPGAEKSPRIYIEMTDDEFLGAEHDPASMPRLEWGRATDALIVYRMERDGSFDSSLYEECLSSKQIQLLKLHRVIDAMRLD